MNYKEEHELSNKGHQLKSALEELECYDYKNPQSLRRIEDLINEIRKITPFVNSSTGEYLPNNLDQCMYIQRGIYIEILNIVRDQNKEIELLTKMFESLLSGIITAKED